MQSEVSLERLEGFLRLLSHDVRNDLSAIDLLATYLQEICPGGEVQEELGQLRASVRFAAQRMVRLSKALQPPVVEWVEYPMADLVEDWKTTWEAGRAQQRELGVDLEWRALADRSLVEVDGLLVFEALGELLDNACAFAVPGSRVGIEAGGCVGELRIRQRLAEESSMAGEAGDWGLFESSRRGRYGVGLFRARRILEAIGAELQFTELTCGEGKEWWTEVKFRPGGGGEAGGKGGGEGS
jgi:K+-sensing histidine kinase KdpD